MYATEFKTVINEPFIAIPEYEKFKGKEVRVVLLNLDNQSNKEQHEDFFDKIIKHPKHIENASFLSREEANER